MSEVGATRRAQRAAADARAPIAEPDPDAPDIGATEWRPAEGIPVATVRGTTRRARSSDDTRVVRAAPVAAPPTPAALVPDAGPTLGAARLGTATKQGPATAMRPLESAGDVLPELDASEAVGRPWWRHPAFLVSAILTVLALVAAVVLIVLGVVVPREAASDLVLEETPDNVRVAWSGADIPWQLIVVGGPAGDEVDVSQLVRGTEAWIPVGADLVDERSCIVVRPAADNETAPVSLDAATVSAQGGASACLGDG